MHSLDDLLHRPTISVSVPPHQREAFFRALVRLKQEDDAVFGSVSALIVKAVIERAAYLDNPHTNLGDTSTPAIPPRAASSPSRLMP